MGVCNPPRSLKQKDPESSKSWWLHEKDVSARRAFFNFALGSLASNLQVKGASLLELSLSEAGGWL